MRWLAWATGWLMSLGPVVFSGLMFVATDNGVAPLWVLPLALVVTLAGAALLGVLAYQAIRREWQD